MSGKIFKRNKGATIVEYALLLMLISVIGLGGLKSTGKQTGAAYTTAANCFKGLSPCAGKFKNPLSAGMGTRR